jgi:aldose 1-epimerase
MSSPNARQRVALSHGDVALDLAPEVGGGIAAFTWRGRNVMRPASGAALAADDPLGLSSFPLVPFAGRVTDGRFTVDGREVRLSPNLPGEPHAIHGQGWRRPWGVASSTDDTARLTLSHPAGEWPWAYAAEQVFTLVDDGLDHTLSVVNQGDAPMPAGLGQHPYFPRGPHTRLTAEVDGVIAFDAEAGRFRRLAPPPDWDWREGRIVRPFVDNAFTGFGGRARIDQPHLGLSVTLSSEPSAAHLVVYAPESGDFTCVEPLTHAVGALDRGDGGLRGGMRLLAPGEAMTLTVRYRLAEVSA